MGCLKIKPFQTWYHSIHWIWWIHLTDAATNTWQSRTGPTFQGLSRTARTFKNLANLSQFLRGDFGWQCHTVLLVDHASNDIFQTAGPSFWYPQHCPGIFTAWHPWHPWHPLHLGKLLPETADTAGSCEVTDMSVASQWHSGIKLHVSRF